METQAMLLRVLEERNFERLGGTKLIRADVRIIVATNRDLQTAIQHGEFRQDLYFRLNGFRIEVPPLRGRKEDIPLLVKHFVSASSERHGKTIEHIEKRAMEMLLAYTWPGNIRELRNVIDTSVIVSPGNTLVIDEDLLLGVKDAISTTVSSLRERLELYERTQIEHALRQTHGRVSGTTGAATLLGMPPSTLSTRLQVLKIDPLKFRMQI
jgi:formate hydrogenlyase transcriptional activator